MKKILALMLAAAMVLALVPMTAMAATEHAVYTLPGLAEAVNDDAQDGDTIKLTADIEINQSLHLTGNRTITIDLNGCKLTGPDDGTANWYAFIVETGATLILKDSSAAKIGVLFAKCYGVETKGGTFIMDGGKIDATTNKGIGAAVVNYGGKVIINDGELIASHAAVHSQGYFADAVTEINGGTLSTLGNDGSAAIEVGGEYNKTSAEVSISGGNVIGNSALSVDTTKGTAKAEVEGGTFSSDVSDYVADGLELVQDADGNYTVTLPIPPTNEPVPTTGDGMGLFVFAGLALISLLGMVVLKKREQF